MKYRKYYYSILFIILIVGKLPAQDSFPVLMGPYFGQKAPVEKAKIFMDEIISTINQPEMCAAFTPDGKEYYYNAQQEGNWTIFVTKEISGKWSKPEPIWFTEDYTDRDFTISPDGKKIFFGSNRPLEDGTSNRNSLDIFVTERLPDGKWSAPKNLGSPVNTDRGENYPSVSRNGNLYFFSQRELGVGLCDLYVSKFADNKYLPPEYLSSRVNSTKHDWDSFIAPDESYIIFSSLDREDTIGGQDLYISFRSENGLWTQAVNMGDRINSVSGEICPSVSSDGKYLFFTSRRRGKADILWITADIINEIKNSLIHK